MLASQLKADLVAFEFIEGFLGLSGVTFLFQMNSFALDTREIGGFPSQFQVTGKTFWTKPAVGQSFLHRAPFLRGVRAVAIMALHRQQIDVRESFIHVLTRRPKVKLAQAGSVDQQAAIWQHDQFPQ